MPPFYSGIAQIPRVSLANLRVAAVSSPFSIGKSIPLVYTCNEKTNLHDEAAVSFRVGSSLVVLLVATYSTLAYYRLVRIAKGIGPIGVDSFTETSFQPKAECSISKPSITLPLGGRLRN